MRHCQGKRFKSHPPTVVYHVLKKNLRSTFQFRFCENQIAAGIFRISPNIRVKRVQRNVVDIEFAESGFAVPGYLFV